ncbi:hypothetical protein UB44_15235 [Burkholderiaceae bacterium 26]|nr:hypothetical protein UB44_15235 [Burkholderiaceae bacterium 26]
MPAHPHNRFQRGAILLEGLIALAILSLGAAAMFRTFDYLEATSHAARQLSDEGRRLLDFAQTR